jgi:hypothetical protein
MGLRTYHRYVANIGGWSKCEGGQLDRFYCIYSICTVYTYTECLRMTLPYTWRSFLWSIHFDITTGTYIRSWTFTETDRRNTPWRTATKRENCVETWEVNTEHGEVFPDSFSYFGNILQQGTTDWRTCEKHPNNTVTEHGVYSTDLAHVPTIWVDEGKLFCKICKMLNSTCQAFGRETSSTFARQPRFALFLRDIRLLQTEWSDFSLFPSTLQ